MAKPTLKMNWTDMGWARIYKDVVREGATHVRAGAIGDKGQAIHPDRAGSPHQMTVATVAALHEFGLGGMERRSYIRSALLWDATARREFQYLMGDVARDIMFNGVPRKIAMKKVGEWAVRRIKEKILSSVPPALSEFTIAKKGHDHSLIDTGTLYDAMDYDVQAGRGGGDE